MGGWVGGWVGVCVCVSWKEAEQAILLNCTLKYFFLKQNFYFLDQQEMLQESLQFCNGASSYAVNLSEALSER